MGTMEADVRQRARGQRRRPAGSARTLPLELLIPSTTVEAVIAAVCDPRAFDAPADMIVSPSKLGGLPTVRAAIAFILHACWRDPIWTRQAPKGWATLQQIGMVIRRDHTSTRDSIQKFPDRCKADSYLLETTMRALDLLADEVEEQDSPRVYAVKWRLERLCEAL